MELRAFFFVAAEDEVNKLIEINLPITVPIHRVEKNSDVSDLHIWITHPKEIQKLTEIQFAVLVLVERPELLLDFENLLRVCWFIQH